MNPTFNLKNIVIVALLAVVAWTQFFGNDEIDNNKYIKVGGKEYIELSNNIDTLYVTRISKDTVFVPEIKTVIKWKDKIVKIPQDVDSLAIVQNYFTINYYEETYKLDSIGSFTVQDSVQMNQIISRKTFYDYRLPIITETTIAKTKPVNQFYFGGNIGFNMNTFVDHISINGVMISKKDRLYGIGIGTGVQNVNGVLHNQTFIQGSIMWRIKWKR